LLVSSVLALTLLVIAGPAAADPLEPTPYVGHRDLRDDYVKPWYIYNDSKLDGILNPGDTEIRSFNNWWTPVSAASQMNYKPGPYAGGTTYDLATDGDQPVAPNNYSNVNDANSELYWLPRKKNTLEFFMTYAQFDNFDFASAQEQSNYDGYTTASNMNKNGWAFSWVAHDLTTDANGSVVKDMTPAGSVDMDIYVHNGGGIHDVSNFGTSRSDPQVTLSSDISHLSYDPVDPGNPWDDEWRPPHFEQALGEYDSNSLLNQMYISRLGITSTEFQQIVDSMEMREWDAYDIAMAVAALDANRTPGQILATLTDHAGNPYTYDDAFTVRSDFAESTTDGGTIAGLAGQSTYDPNEGNWGDQQVIRIDLGESILADGSISEIVFFDFGDSDSTTWGTSTSDQVNPEQITFGVDLSYSYEHGQVYYELPGGDRIWFPENRLYIAQAPQVVPEPATMAMLSAGAGLCLLRRRRRKA
jgi:hypothetical protein